jgi:CDP-diacylglycerol--serine O-phosphatidyltransferase
LLPIYLNFLGVPRGIVVTWIVFAYTLTIAFLMVSRLPVFSGKRVGKRVPPEMVLPVFVVIVLFFALLISYPWEVLTVGTLIFLACLPLGWLSYRDYERKAAAAAMPAVDTAADDMRSPLAPGQPSEPGADDRPPRLN